jgi:sigma-B regulation protein RsbU (phosphoserine phosphatase)
MEMDAAVVFPDPGQATSAEIARDGDRLRKMERLANDLLNVILPLGIALSAEKSLDRLLEKIVIEATALCQADAGTLYLRTKDDRLKFAIMRTDSLAIALGGTTGKEIPLPPVRMYDEVTAQPNEHNVASHVALHGITVNVPDIYTAALFDFSGTKNFDQANHYRSKSTLTVPMKDKDDRVIAVLQLLNAQDPKTGDVIAFDEYQALVVESLASQASVALNNQLLLDREKELLKFERDLQIGRQIQIGFLPETLPQPPGWQIAARFRPAREVAGDFYDAFMLADGRVGIVIADVCDKGVGAALFMALVRSLIRAYLQLHAASGEQTASGAATMNALREAIVRTNDYIGENHINMNMFATTFAAVVDPATGVIEYVNGGHNPPAVIGPHGITERLMPTGPAVGIVPGFLYRLSETRLAPDEVLVAFTDGAADARSPQGEFFSEPRLLRGVVKSAQERRSADALVNSVLEDLVAHISTAAQYDDITLMAVRRLPLS